MAYLENKSQKEYYQGKDYGNYQFVSLEDIINQFIAVYVGRDKIIPRVNRADIVYHAQRALSELSFDTLKSFKSQQIDLPASCTMILPHDYVNYTKISSVDSAGIKHPLYPTKHTSNPFQIRQEESGDYDFPEGVQLVENGDFSEAMKFNWHQSPGKLFGIGPNPQQAPFIGSQIIISTGEVLNFQHNSHDTYEIHGKALAIWQEIDVSEIDYIDISANGTSQAAGNSLNSSDAAHTIPDGVLRFGVSTQPGSTQTHPSSLNPLGPSPNVSENIFDIAYLEWTGGESGSKEKLGIDVSMYNEIFVLITSHIPHTNHATSPPFNSVFGVNTIDDIAVVAAYQTNKLQPALGASQASSTWSSYKAHIPTENNINDYQDYENNVYWPNEGERYGLDPVHAQVNGSFYIDELRGKIHFSSNISGKTVILDYISDSLGTEKEMKVHKFAVDAMYKHILYDVAYSRVDIRGGMLASLKKDKFAAVRKAKLRLSNFKLEELTQILRGKSKHIKH